MKNNDETVKLMAETIKAGLTKFIGQNNTEDTRTAMQSHMVSVLESFKNIADLRAPIPSIKVTIHCNEAYFTFFDPKTKEEIAINTWMARASEGYYE